MIQEFQDALVKVHLGGFMSIDMSKLTPAPWLVSKPRMRCRIKSGEVFVMEAAPDGDIRMDADAEFIALARNAFDVMMRRKWNPNYQGGTANPGWFVCDVYDQPIFPLPDDTGQGKLFADPFTALVEADHRYRQNVEGGK